MTIPYSAVRKLLDILEPYGDVVHDIAVWKWPIQSVHIRVFLARNFDMDSLRERFEDLSFTYRVTGRELMILEEGLFTLDGARIELIRVVGEGLEAVKKYADQLEEGEE